MLEMWVLVWISLYDPAYGVSVDSLGTFSDHESCVYEMREAEIMINRSNEGMLCLRVGPEEMYEDVTKSDHGLKEELQ
jgi:hypothetical protein